MARTLYIQGLSAVRKLETYTRGKNDETPADSR